MSTSVLVVVLSVLFGLVAMQAAPCLDRADGSGHDNVSALTLIDTASADAPEGVASSTPLDIPAGLVGLCVVVLLAVLFAMAGLERLCRLTTVPGRHLAGRHVVRRRRPPPDLVVLCVLRT